MDHRKYHWLYFVLGICIAVILATLMGCSEGTSDSGIVKEKCLSSECPPLPPEDCMFDWGVGCIETPPIQCCMALIPECMACADQCSVDEWIKKTCGEDAIDAEYAGWDEEKNEPIWLCQAIIID